MGYTGTLNSVIGINSDVIIERFLSYPKAGKFAVDVKPPFILTGAVIEVDSASGKAVSIERVSVTDNEINTLVQIEEPDKKHHNQQNA